MNNFLKSKNFPSRSEKEDKSLESSLNDLLQADYKGSFFTLLGGYRKVLSDNKRRKQWDEMHKKLMTLFKCGKNTPIDGPMIGVSMSLRDSDYFRKTAELFGDVRSAVVDIEFMATGWNATFANTGIWMGKTFEPVSKEKVAQMCEGNPLMMATYDSRVTRIGRNFFREPHDPNLLQGAGMPVLTELWRLKERPMSTDAKGFDGQLLEKNIEKERNIPYSKTGGLFLANPGISMVDEMNGKSVYQLNYRWPALEPVYPMTRLIDEIVQIDDGIYLGQLVMATKNYSLGRVKLPGGSTQTIGVPYRPGQNSGGFFGSIVSRLTGRRKTLDYGYQNNGFFLMIDPTYAEQAYAEDAFRA